MGPTLLERAARWVRRRLPTKPHPAILMYHRIGEDTFDPWGVGVSPTNFADHLNWLKRHRTPVALTEFVRRHWDATLPADAIAITFDDGYACNALTAAPMLEALQIPATIFIAADLIEKEREIWWDELKRLVLDSSVQTVKVSGEQVDLGPRMPNDWHWQNERKRRTPRQSAYYDIWGRLRLMSGTDRDAAMAELRANSPTPGSKTNAHRLMTAEEARSIGSALIDFGSHGLTHARLPGLPFDKKAREIRESLAACQRVTGTKPEAFAYAYGEFDDESQALVEQSGFACACTTGHRLVSATDQIFALPRIHVWNRDRRWLRQTLASPAA